ncbi:phytase [Montanilutibacter psychrotolerans]|uniref:Phytase n=1 Tax=Montanilutibacter psychrotolerans TaxID=1327343 RepID=A0A3M8SZ75_9GAMM|nr:phytase [Lysobacter psychrotolerans]RNF86005.1 phytase [Lysobacter psychrotolerans]
MTSRPHDRAATATQSTGAAAANAARHASAALIALALAACASTRPHDSSTSSLQAKPAGMATTAPVVVTERFVSQPSGGDELDSLATWPTPEGGTWLVATAKSSHQLVVFDGDSGERLRTVGGEGSDGGQFKRPNGIAVHGDTLFVAERDNHRVQAFALPAFAPLGTFGADVLRSPYGIWVRETEPGELEAYVTDSFMYGKKFDQVPEFAELDQRVRRFRVNVAADALRTEYAGSFGDTAPASALRMVESIAGDPAHDRLLIADEDRRHASTLREYSFSGHFTGRSVPEASFGAEAEGVALWSCPDGSGYWLAVDQLAPLAIFHLFDRQTLEPRGSFRGTVTSYTDGVALHAAATPSFPGGVLYAVHDDKAVAAFDLRDVVRALGLNHGCTE